MYIPAHFLETDVARVQSVIANFPLAAVVAQTGQGLVANHFPLMFTGPTTLTGHLALANDLHRLLDDGSDVLAIFQAGDAYISPNWYPSKAVNHEAVPTWNYQTVHIHGRITFQHDNKAKIAAVGRLTQKHEHATNDTSAWTIADAPKDYFAEKLDQIVAFEIDVTQVLAKSKLSQNRSAADIASVTDALDARGNTLMSAQSDHAAKPD